MLAPGVRVMLRAIFGTVFRPIFRPMFRPRQLVRLLGVSFAVSFLVSVAAFAAQVSKLQPQGYVDDFAGVVNAGTRQQLTDICTEVDQKTRQQIAVVTVTGLDGETVDDFAFQLASKWGVGAKKGNGGVMILLAPSDHKYAIEVGYGLEGILPDGKVGGFGREAVPRLKAGDYSGALLLITQRVAETIATDRGLTIQSLSKSPAAPQTEEPQTQGPQIFPWAGLVIGLIVIFFLIRAFAGRRGSGCFFLPLMMMGGGGGGGSWGGGGGFGGGGGGFGGFGGGSFGGGGASGSW